MEKRINENRRRLPKENIPPRKEKHITVILILIAVAQMGVIIHFTIKNQNLHDELGRYEPAQPNVILEIDGAVKIGKCSNCNNAINSRMKFCPYCGKAADWDSAVIKNSDEAEENSQ